MNSFQMHLMNSWAPNHMNFSDNSRTQQLLFPLIYFQDTITLLTNKISNKQFWLSVLVIIIIWQQKVQKSYINSSAEDYSKTRSINTCETVKSYPAVCELNYSPRCRKEMRYSSSTSRSTIINFLTMSTTELSLQRRVIVGIRR